MATTSVTAGTYGGATAVPTLTIDAFGRVTAAGFAAISGLDASVIATGTLATARLGSIPASSISGNISTANGGSQWTSSAANIYFSTGSVGIGTATPAALLDVAGGARSTSHALVGNGTLTLNAPASGNYSLAFPNNGGANGQVLTSLGNGTLAWASAAGSGTVTSLVAGAGLSGGTITTAGTISLANTSVTATTYGSLANFIPWFVVNSQGQLTSAGSTAVGGLDGSTITTGTLPIARLGIIPASSVSGVLANGSTILAADGTAAAPGFAFNNKTNTGIYRPGGATIAISTNGTEALRIDSGGNVGIGTTSPSYILDVNGGAATANVYPVHGFGNATSNGVFLVADNLNTSSHQAGLQIRNQGSRIWTIGDDFNTNATDDLFFYRTGANPYVVFTNGGNVGIGTTSPGAPLDVHVGSPGNGNLIAQFGTSVSPRIQFFDELIASSLGPELNFVSGNPAKISASSLAIDIAGNVTMGSSTQTGSQWTHSGNSEVDLYVYGKVNAGINGDAIYGSNGNYKMDLQTNGTTALTIDTAQRVGIGTTVPIVLLDVAGNSRSWTHALVGNGTVTLAPPSSGTYTLTLPASPGTAGFALVTNGSGALSWGTFGGGGGNGGTVTSIALGTGLTGGPITTAGTIALGTTGVAATTYGSLGTFIPFFTVNAEGQLTSAGSTAINNLNASVISSGVLSASNGGTGMSTAAAGNGQFLIGNGSGFSLGTLQVSGGLTQTVGSGAIALTTNGTFSNTANTLVMRDSSGNFSAGKITSGSLALGTLGFVTLNGPASGSSYALTFPQGAGTSGQVLASLGGGTLGWSVMGGGGQWTSGSMGIYYTGGSVGIGTSTLATMLTVNGDATINGMTVGLGSGMFASNTVIGQTALQSNSTGAQNTAVGQTALSGNSTGSQNTAVGKGALSGNGTGSYNVAVGFQALFSGNGSRNLGLGPLALKSTNGTDNVAVGYQAGNDVTAGSENIFIGSFPTTGVGITSGTNNILLGYDVRPSLQTGNNQLNIGNLIYATGLSSGTVAASGSIGIGTSAMLANLHVVGNSTGTFGAIAGFDKMPAIFSSNSSSGFNAVALNNSSGSSAANEIIFDAVGVPRWFIGNDSNNNGTQDFWIWDAFAGGGVPRFYINSAGSVGIGTATPQYGLDVSGTARATALTLTNTASVTLAAQAGASYTLTLPSTAPSSGQVMQSDGSGNLSWQNVSGSSGLNYQEFTASGTWTKPSSGNLATVECWGGGGGGGAVSGSNPAGGGGGGYFEKRFKFANLPSSVSVTIGTGGVGGASPAAGTSTTFGTFGTAAGGNAAFAGTPGSGGAYSSNYANASVYSGGKGGSSSASADSAIWGGGGGGGCNGTIPTQSGASENGGAGGASSCSSGSGSNGVAPGGGGGAGSTGGGSGANGACRITVW
ncbi:MAG: hypothetical protein C5B49_08375 [Bdellovibrio sp.]|nr:MAG: hypothetical protein C5B49_08375 [Bdellovibrio sp.]